MKPLIIYAHPHTGGHCAEILKEVTQRLHNAKIKHDVIDLYRIKYDPVLHEAEHYTRGKRKISAENRKFQKMIADADSLIFIYPVWWGSMPAILKGFMDRVLTPGFAFRYEGSRPIGLLHGKHALIYQTTGSPWFFNLFMGCARKLMKYELFFCGIRSKVCVLSSARKFDAKAKKRIARMVPKGLVWLFGEEWK
jgi:NAD(P)H dehydrogenase (quinone)